MSNKRYTEEEIKEHVENNSSCKFVGTYMTKIGSNRRRILQLICKCGKEFEVQWVKFNRSDGKKQRQCQKCGREERGKKQRMTDEEYIQLKKEKGIEIEHLEPASGKNKKIRHRCPKCGDENWYALPKNILRKYSTRCPKCQLDSIKGRNKLDDETYQWMKLQKGIDIVNIETYIDRSTPIKHICPDCNEEWKVSPSGVLSKNEPRCESCSYKKRGENRVYTDKEVESIVNEMGAEWISGKYEGKNSVLTFKCECGNTFKKKFNYFQSGWTRCRKCAASVSTGEYRIKKWLEKKNVPHTFQRKFDELRGKRNMPLSYDFSIDNENREPIVLIEYDGEHHFKPMYHRHTTKEEAEKSFETVKKYDKRKDEFAKQKDIPLVRLSAKQYEKLDTILGHLL